MLKQSLEDKKLFKVPLYKPLLIFHQLHSTHFTARLLDNMDFLQGPKIGAAIPHQSAVKSLSFHEDGRHLFAATPGDKKLYLIDAQHGKCDKPGFRCEQVGLSSVSST